MMNFESLSTAELVAFYNDNSDKPVTRFASRAAAIARCEKLAAALGDKVNESVAAITPEPPAAPVFEEVEKADKEAQRLRRSNAIQKSWEKVEVAEKRRQRHGVVVEGNGMEQTGFRSVKQAFDALDLPLSVHIDFRGRLKAAGSLDEFGYHWIAVQNKSED